MINGARGEKTRQDEGKEEEEFRRYGTRQDEKKMRGNRRRRVSFRGNLGSN